MGYRYGSSISDSSRVWQSTGGPFQPTILPILDFGCRYIGEKWGTKYDHYIVENGYPSPRWKESLFYVMMPPKDTLGMLTQQLELNRTALGEMYLPLAGGTTMAVSDSKNSYGMLYFSPDVPLPILQEVTSENKMKIYTDDGDPTETMQFYDSKIILEKYVNSDGKTIYENYPDKSEK
jgi:hypothetical protein